ncbi:HAMP domain-containing histidine kinase, partial [Patescibacteria group bacterium]|nr:HAMP domain-containing histidine kinase [Patescibacteria group bacterium]
GKDVLIKDEIKFQRLPVGIKRFLISNLNQLDASLCLPLFSEKNLIGFFVLNKKEEASSYSKEEIEEIIDLKRDLEVGLMNVLLKMNLQEENNLMKAIIDRKTKNLQKKIKQINELLRQQSDFIAVTAHEFRTPLNIASFQMEEILESSKGEEKEASELVDDLKVIDTSLGNLKDLMKKLFSVQQYDLNKVEVKKEKTSMKDFINEIYKDFISVMSKKKIKLSLKDGLKNKTNMEIDRSQVRQVFHNILNNAYKHTEKKGRVEIQIEKNKDGVLIKICDNGKGIPKASRKRIFEKFQTVNMGSGIGLGLYICKKVVELHRGEVWVEDADLGGAAFCFTLRN